MGPSRYLLSKLDCIIYDTANHLEGLESMMSGRDSDSDTDSVSPPNPILWSAITKNTSTPVYSANSYLGKFRN